MKNGAFQVRFEYDGEGRLIIRAPEGSVELYLPKDKTILVMYALGQVCDYLINLLDPEVAESGGLKDEEVN